MKITIIFIFIFFRILLVIRGDHLDNYIISTVLKQLLLNVTHTIDPYQIVLITNENNDNVYTEANHIRILIFQNFPTITIDFENINILDNIIKCDIGSLRQSALFIILYIQTSQKNLLDIELVQNRYVESFPRSPRPKWLILLLTESADQKYEINLTLQKSWKNKFVDITIVEIIQTNLHLKKIVVYYYNPFSNYSTRRYYNSSDTDIFPEKIREMNGYSLSTIFYSDPPGIDITQDIDDVLKISGIHYWIIKTISDVLNFTIKIHDSGEFNFTKLLDAIKLNHIDFSGNQIYFWNNEPFDKSMVLRPDGYCVVVPIFQVTSARAKSRLYFGLLLTTFHILIIITASKLLKFDKSIWIWINIFEIILGMPAPKLPKNSGERLLVGCIIILSLTYTSVFYARMTDNNLKSKEDAPMNNFNDLDQSGLIPLVHTDLYNNTFDIFDNRSTVMKNLKRKARIWDNAVSCVDELSKNETIACIMSEQLGNFLIKNFTDDDGMLKMRVMQPCFWTTWRGYAFAPGSPYQEKFDTIIIRIFETGFIQKWIKSNDLESAKTKTQMLDTGFILEHMSTILTAGYLLSCFVFLIELIVYDFKLSAKNS